MTFQHTPCLVRTSLATLAFTLGVGLTGCGGGSDDLTGVQTAAQTSSDRKTTTLADRGDSVSVQGCVVDRHYIPITGVPVRVLSAQGRLLGNAQSDGQGHFTLRLPTATDVLLQVDRPQGESLTLRVGTTPQRWDTCLQDDQA